MTASPSPNGVAPSEPDWVAAYEALRRTALEEADAFGRQTAGIAMLRRAGVVAWMQTCRSVARVLPAVRPGEMVTSLPGSVRADVAVLLAQMALSATSEMATS